MLGGRVLRTRHTEFGGNGNKRHLLSAFHRNSRQLGSALCPGSTLCSDELSPLFAQKVHIKAATKYNTAGFHFYPGIKETSASDL